MYAISIIIMNNNNNNNNSNNNNYYLYIWGHFISSTIIGLIAQILFKLN